MSKKTLIQKLVSIMEKVERIPKNGYNSFHKYNYALESDVKDACRNFMAEEGVLMTFSVEHVDQRRDDIVRVHSKVTFHDADSDQTVEFEIAGDGQDKNDKGIYKAITGSTKYALMSTFLIPTGDDPEKDSVVTKTENKHGYRTASGEKKEFPNPAKDKKFATPKQKKAIEAFIGKELDKKRDEFKKWAESRKSIGKTKGKSTLNLLSREFAGKILDNTEAAKNAFNEWLKGQEEPSDADKEFYARVSEWNKKLPREVVESALAECNVKQAADIVDLAERHKLLELFESKYDIMSAELAAEMEEGD